MKRMIIVSALLSANAAHAEKGARLPSDVCKEWGDFAERVMTMRQKQTPMHEAINAIPIAGRTDAYKAIVLDAYESRPYDTKELQDRSISSFRNGVELACYKRN